MLIKTLAQPEVLNDTIPVFSRRRLQNHTSRIDALGGVDVNVLHDMNYDDNGISCTFT